MSSALSGACRVSSAAVASRNGRGFCRVFVKIWHISQRAGARFSPAAGQPLGSIRSIFLHPASCPPPPYSRMGCSIRSIRRRRGSTRLRRRMVACLGGAARPRISWSKSTTRSQLRGSRPWPARGRHAGESRQACGQKKADQPGQGCEAGCIFM